MKVLAEVPLSSFLAITQTSSGLRDFLEVNAARICNLAIQTRFSRQADVHTTWKSIHKDERFQGTCPDIIEMRLEYACEHERDDFFQPSKCGYIHLRTNFFMHYSDLGIPPFKLRCVLNMQSLEPMLCSFLNGLETCEIKHFDGTPWTSLAAENQEDVLNGYAPVLFEEYKEMNTRLPKEMTSIDKLLYRGILEDKEDIPSLRVFITTKMAM
jgi:hypothetical protein